MSFTTVALFVLVGRGCDDYEFIRTVGVHLHAHAASVASLHFLASRPARPGKFEKWFRSYTHMTGTTATRYKVLSHERYTNEVLFNRTTDCQLPITLPSERKIVIIAVLLPPPPCPLLPQATLVRVHGVVGGRLCGGGGSREWILLRVYHCIGASASSISTWIRKNSLGMA